MFMDVKENLAQNIALHRKHLKLTQAELAEKLNYSDKAVSKWERAEAVPELNVLVQLSELFGVTIDSLLKPCVGKKVHKTHNLGKRRLTLAIWSTSIVWLVATLCFAFIGIIFPTIENTWLSFIIAIPITMIVLLVFTSVWGKNLWNFIFTSMLIWTALLSVFLVLFFALPQPPTNLWLVFIIGVPLHIFMAFIFLYRRAK